MTLFSFILIFLSFTFSFAAEISPTVIVGGGLSGLTTAYHYDKKSEIYEAQDYLGGRVRTQREKGWQYEHCATFIDQDHHEMLSLCQIFGISLNKINFADRITTFSFQGKLICLQDISTILGDIKTTLDDILREHKENGTELIQTQAYLNLPALSKAMIEFYTLDSYGISFNELHALALSQYNFANKLGAYAQFFKACSENQDKAELNEVFFNYTVLDGADHIIQHLVKALQEKQCVLHTSHILKRIRKNAEGDYVLSFDNRGYAKEVRCKNVVLTLPFTALRNVQIDFSVPLSVFQHQTIRNLPYGHHIKVGAALKDFSDMQNRLLYHIDLDHKFIAWPGTNALTFYISPPHPDFDKNKLPQLVESTLELLKSVYVTEDSNFSCLRIHDVKENAFMGGTHSTLHKSGNEFYVYDAADHTRWLYAKSPDEHLYFAGEHTMADGSQTYQEAAVRSGKIVGNLLKGR